ncbi:hypothetical protein [Brevibacillus sp. AF8]|uniref:hypothetical protein n=1 Tax=Brevibacillus sp. AF8 TaxID=2825881 RepID=UPI001E657F9A|nr:hypothetical protein [Brevibacillus sp. AF8]MCE0453036.1 hypothetical protein [Brevibacillus sp. AF8]
MYSVTQLQAMDYILKRITLEESYPFFRKNLKLVVEINGSFWYGDFIQMDGLAAKQLFIDDSGEIECDKFYPTGSNAITLLKQIWDAYVTAAKNETNPFWNNPFRSINDLSLLFEALTRILDLSNIVEDSSPFNPYFLNAHTLDGTLQLTFINLNSAKIKLVSIIEVKN